MTKIVKIILWRNPTPLYPRWDLEIVREDGTRERVTAFSNEAAKEILALAEKGRRIVPGPMKAKAGKLTIAGTGKRISP